MSGGQSGELRQSSLESDQSQIPFIKPQLTKVVANQRDQYQRRVIIKQKDGRQQIFEIRDKRLVTLSESETLKKISHKEIKINGETISKLILNSMSKQDPSSQITSQRESAMNKSLQEGLGTPALNFLRQQRGLSPQSIANNRAVSATQYNKKFLNINVLPK